jgi:flagellin
MRISHNIAAMNTYRQYNINTASTNKAMGKLSSGYRINNAADDAAGLSISEKMRSQIRGLAQATRNTQDGVSFLQTAEGALGEVSDMLTRLKELTVQVPNGTYSTADRNNIGSEMKALGTAISQIYENTTFNGIKVFGNQIASGGILASNNGTLNAASIKYGEDAGQAVDIKSAATMSLNALTVKTAAADSAPSDVHVSDVASAITEVVTTRAKYGAQQNQLDHATNNMAATRENLQAAESRIRDVDMAEEMMTYTRSNILLQASQAMLAQANAQPQGILQLLR